MDPPESNVGQQEQEAPALTDDCKNQCLQYLLSELDPEQVTLFEKKLGESDLLADELQRQAEMIVKLSETSTPPFTIARSAKAATSPSANHQKHNVLAKALCIALAVCLAGILIRTWWGPTNNSKISDTSIDRFDNQIIADDPIINGVSETTLIARAWAATRFADQELTNLQETAPTETEVQVTKSRRDEVNELELPLGESEISSSDPFSWMFTAAVAIDEVETNDG